MNKEEKRKIKEQQEKRKFIEKKYMTAMEALLEACNQSGVSYDEVFSKYDVNFCTGRDNEQILEAIEEINLVITELSKKFFSEKWLSVFNECFSEKYRYETYGVMKQMLESEPADAFLSYSKTYTELNKFCNNKQEEALFDFEDFSSKNTLEEVINTYGMTIYSKYSGLIVDALVRGFTRNKNVDKSNILAYFGGKEL